MYRPGVSVDPWYENFKFFLTYWLLSSNNRERMGEVDQLPPQPPGPQYMSPHQKAGLPPPPPHQKQASPPGTWDTQEKHQNSSSRQSLSDSYSDSVMVKSHLPTSTGPSHPSGHPVGGQGLGPPDQSVDKDRRHVCPHCYKGFRSRQQLNQHNLVHSGVRKYHCHYCERSFKQLSHLQQHHRIHTGEKPYKCPLDGCDKAFAQMSNLQHHMRQHDKATFGQKQCMCPFCDRGYASEKSLKSHVSKMHPDSKMLNMSPRPKMSLMDHLDGPHHHPLMGTSPQPGPISHRHSLPTMHHKMKSPMSPVSSMAPGSSPLELTVNSLSHQRNSLPQNDSRKYLLGDPSKYPMIADRHEEAKYLDRGIMAETGRYSDRDHGKFMNSYDQRYSLTHHQREPKYDRPFETFGPRFPPHHEPKYDSSPSKLHGLDNFGDFRPRFPENHIHPLNRRDDLHLLHGPDMIPGRGDLSQLNNGRDSLQHMSNGRDSLGHLNNGREDLPLLSNGRDDLSHLNNGRDDLSHMSNGRDDLPHMNAGRDDLSHMNNGQDDLSHLSNGRDDLQLLRNRRNSLAQMANGRDSIIQLNNHRESLRHIPGTNDDMRGMGGRDDMGRMNGQEDLRHLKDDLPPLLNGRDTIHQMRQQGDVSAINGHEEMHRQDNTMKYVSDQDVIKRPPSSNQPADPNLIRQRKRKPANPQHVFMPSIDHYTSFATEEIEDCSGLMMEVENGAGTGGGQYERKMARTDIRD